MERTAETTSTMTAARTTADLPPGAVVVAFDGSDPARDAVHWAVQEVAGTGRPVRLLHALRWPLPELADLGLPPAALDLGRAWQAALAGIELAIARCRQQSPQLDIGGSVLAGDAVESLTTAAAEADLLVLGASGQSGGPQVLLGSSAGELLRTVSRPVVVVRNRPARGQGPVVIGIDGSPASDRALRFGFDLAARRGHDVVAVSAWSDLPLGAFAGAVDLDRDDLEDRAAARLSAFMAETEREHREVRVHQVTSADHPAQALLSRSAGAALLVVGRHGRTGSRAPLGSVSHAVAHYAPCPVAVVGAD